MRVCMYVCLYVIYVEMLRRWWQRNSDKLLTDIHSSFKTVYMCKLEQYVN
jgi:hypothetical protein